MTFRPGYITEQDIEIPQGGDFALLLGVYATEDVTGDEYLIDTTGYTSAFTVRATDADGDVQIAATEIDYCVVGFSPVKWAVATVYGVGEQVVPTSLNGYVYECTIAGTSHATTEPVWPTVINNTIADNTATWKCLKVDTDQVSNLQVQLPTAVTQALTDWSGGIYTLQLVDPDGHLALWMDGEARLRREATY